MRNEALHNELARIGKPVFGFDLMCSRFLHFLVTGER